MANVGDGNKNYSLNPISRFVNEKVEDSLIKTNTIIPAKILSYDENTNKAVVIPIFKLSLRTGESFIYNPIPDIPVFHFGSKQNSCFYSKVSKDDTGLLLVSQRSLDEWKLKVDLNETPEPYEPKNKRRHNMSDAFFIPGCFHNVDNGIKTKGQMTFENELTDLREILESLSSDISTLRTVISTIHVAIPASFAASVITAGSGAAYLAATSIVNAQLISLSARLLANETKIKLLLKKKTSLTGIISNVLSRFL